MYSYFIEKMEQKLKSADKGALIFIDVDNFKYVNDTYGHIYGDCLLERLYVSLTRLINENCTIYRIGGDKFIILVERFEAVMEIERLAVTILKGLKDPVKIDEIVFYCTVSISPDSIEIEVAEPILVEAYDSVIGNLRTLSEKGLRITLDGFGRGYSSMSFLKELPVTSLKIDKVFVGTINGEQESTSMVDFMLHITRGMDLNILATGVETREQFDYLRKIGFNGMQGYFLGRPLPEKDAIGKLRDNGKSDREYNG